MSLAALQPVKATAISRLGLTPVFRLLLVALLALGIGAVTTVNAPAAHADAPRLTSFDNRMLTLVNEARSDAGLPQVQAATGLTNLSLWWSNQMAAGATNNVLKHNPNAFEQTLTYGASNRTAWAENVAKWSPASLTADSIFDKYMASPGHKANILGSNYRYIGIGSVTGSNGASYNTMTFTDKVEPGQEISFAPVGSVDSVTVADGKVRITGWAYDPAATEVSVPTHIYLNGTGLAVTADVSRTDVNAAFGITGNHGFDAQMPAVSGENKVCVYAISVSGRGNTLISCSTVTWVPIKPTTGSIDNVSASGTTVSYAGWAYDPNKPAASVAVHVYLNGALATGVSAGNPRQDVNNAYGISGNHGFDSTVTAPVGANQVCIYAISVSGGTNSLLGCRTVTVAAPQPTTGSIDLVARSGSSIRVSGWAFDPGNSSASVQVHVYANSSGVAIGTTFQRTDVNNAFGISGDHGFDATMNAPTTGPVNVCFYAISASGGANTMFGCRSV